MGILTAARRRPWTFALVLAVVVFVLPQMGLNYSAERQIELSAFLVLIASGLNLSLGYAGELALGQVAIYAFSAYVAGYMGAHGETTIILQLLAAMGTAVLLGLITGIPGLRLANWSLAMTSFFLVLLIRTILQIFHTQTNAPQGLAGILTPTIFGHVLTTDQFYLTVTVVTALWLLVMRNLVASRHGTGFRVLRQSPVLASSLGIPVYRTKLAAYALGALPAGLAGCLFANLQHLLTPTTFTFTLAISVVAASIIGGATSIYGAILGGLLLTIVPNEVSSFNTYTTLVYGLFLLGFGVLLGGGVAGALQRLLARADRAIGWMRSPVPESPAPALGTVPGAELAVEGIGKSFGGVRALDGVSLTAAPGQVTALIGPNGSGKTTLLNMICGYYGLDEGVVRIGGEVRRRREKTHRIADAGVARTFQTANIPKDISVVEAVRAGRYRTDRVSMASTILRLPRYWAVRRRDTEEAMRVLQQVGIAHLADQEAASLPLGTRRLLELARALVRRPRVLLLDEVASGLDENEVDQLASLVHQIRDAGGTVVLVEHNFRLVLSLADVIYVLAEGVVIAKGTPAEIERDPRVLSEYLGVKTGTQALGAETLEQVEAEQ